MIPLSQEQHVGEMAGEKHFVMIGGIATWPYALVSK